MGLTPNSAATSFCTAAQFVSFYDWRPFSQLLSDTDVPLSSAAAVQASPALATILQGASGKVEMATSIGNRYQPSDLTTLAGTTTNMAAKLARLVADIAAEECYRRRVDGKVPPLEQFKEASETLTALAEGAAIFGFIETMNAGVLADQVEVAGNVEARNMITFQAARLFGRRANRNDPY
jgi:hypothetical protein